MEDPALTPSSDNADSSPQIQQNLEGNDNQAIGEMTGGTAIGKIVGNVIYNYYYREDVKTVIDDRVTSADADPLPCPYRGLFHFGPGDAEYFFGRESFVEELFKATQTRNFIPLLGASGSGKSSVVLAGLVPKLQQAGHWQFTHFRPGSDPFYALAEALVPLYMSELDSTDKIDQAEKLAKSLKNGTPLARIFSSIQRQHPNDRVLLIADQFEELYTLCTDETTRRNFLDRLLGIAVPTDLIPCEPVLVATMRADFLGNALAYRPFADVLQNADLKLGPMNRAELTEVIEKPAQKLGVTFEAGLVERILGDVDAEPGILPLLEFALTELWQRRSGKQLTHAAYDAIGGVGGALAKEARRIYGSLPLEEQGIARRVFLGLVQLGEGGKDTRRRVELERLVSHRYNLEQVKKTIDRFARYDARLITLANDEGKVTAEVTHEALFDNWQQLKDWLDVGRSDLRFQRRLDEAAMSWEGHGRPEGNLWRSPNLDLLRDFKESAGDDLTPLQLEFFKASIDAEQAQKQAEEKAAKEKKRQRQVLFGVMSTGLVLTSGTAIFADRQSHIANIERNSSLALRQLEKSPINALIFAMEGGQELEDLKNIEALVNPKLSPNDYPTMHPVLALQTILDKIQLQNEIDTFQQGINSITFNKNLSFMATADGDGKVKLWNKDGSQKKDFQIDLKTKINSVRFAQDGTIIAIAGDNGSVSIWNLETKTLRKFNAHFPSGVRNIRFGTKDEDILVTSGRDGKIKLWSRKDILQKSWLAHPGGVEVVTFSNNDKLLLTGGKDKFAKLWDRSGNQIVKFVGHAKTVKSVKFSPYNEDIITASEDDTVKIWDREGNLKQTIPSQGKAGQDGINAVEYYDGQLITAGNDGTIKIWDLQGANPTIIQAHNGRIETMRLNKNNTLTTAGQKDGIVKTWKLPEQQNQSTKSLIGHKKSVNSIRFSPDNKLVVTASSDGTVKLWDFQAGGLIKTFHENIKPIHGIETVRFIYKGDTKLILTGGEKDSLVRIWNLEGQLQKEFNTDQKGIHSISINKNYLSTTGYDRSVKLWNINIISDTEDNPPILEKILKHKENIKTSRFSLNGKFVAVGGENGLLRVWRVDPKEYLDQEKQIDLIGNQGIVNSIGFSPNGEMLAAVGADNKIRIWSFSRFTDLPSDNPQIIDTPFKSFQSVNFSPDGKLIATTTEDGKVQFWTLSGQQLADFKIHSQKVRSADFSSDGAWFATASEDGKAMISRVRTLKELLDQGCEWLKIHLESNANDNKRLPRCNKSSEH